jgi:molybdate transport system substrate-binding protein
MGTGLAFIPSRLQRGEAADVVIVDDTALLQMIKDGLVMPDSRVALARSSIGMAVRAGAPKPDISSVDAPSELLPVPGIDYVGPLPPPVQRATVFSAGVVAASQNPNAARALIACLASPAAARIITKSGMEPMVTKYEIDALK